MVLLGGTAVEFSASLYSAMNFATINGTRGGGRLLVWDNDKSITGSRELEGSLSHDTCTTEILFSMQAPNSATRLRREARCEMRDADQYAEMQKNKTKKRL